MRHYPDFTEKELSLREVEEIQHQIARLGSRLSSGLLILSSVLISLHIKNLY